MMNKETCSYFPFGEEREKHLDKHRKIVSASKGVGFKAYVRELGTLYQIDPPSLIPPWAYDNKCCGVCEDKKDCKHRDVGFSYEKDNIQDP